MHAGTRYVSAQHLKIQTVGARLQDDRGVAVVAGRLECRARGSEEWWGMLAGPGLATRSQPLRKPLSIILVAVHMRLWGGGVGAGGTWARDVHKLADHILGLLPPAPHHQGE